MHTGNVVLFPFLGVLLQIIILNIFPKLQLVSSVTQTKQMPLACGLLDTTVCSDPNITDSTVSSYGRVIMIGDIHGSYDGLLEVLFNANITASIDQCVWSESIENLLVVQMGDIVDRGPGASEAWNCLHDLQISAPKNTKLVRLLGNHELYWLQGYTHSRNKLADTEYKIKSLVKKMRDEILSGHVTAAYTMRIQNVPILFTHAGIRPTFYEYIQDIQHAVEAEDIAKYMNDKLLKSMQLCRQFPCSTFNDEVYEAGKDRGGRHIGGPYWTDFSILANADLPQMSTLPPMIQIVGHTMAWCYDPSRPEYSPTRDELECGDGLIRRTKRLSAICTDAGMYAGARAFLELRNNSRFIAHEKESDGTWSSRDFMEEVC